MQYDAPISDEFSRSSMSLMQIHNVSDEHTYTHTYMRTKSDATPLATTEKESISDPIKLHEVPFA